VNPEEHGRTRKKRKKKQLGKKNVHQEKKTRYGGVFLLRLLFFLLFYLKSSGSDDGHLLGVGVVGVVRAGGDAGAAALAPRRAPLHQRNEEEHQTADGDHEAGHPETGVEVLDAVLAHRHQSTCRSKKKTEKKTKKSIVRTAGVPFEEQFKTRNKIQKENDNNIGKRVKHR